MEAEYNLPELLGRLRINESRLSNLRERLLVTDTNTISEFKKVSSEMRDINSDIKSIKHDLIKIQETLRDVVREMNNFARVQEIKVLEKYINMWNPLNFVTQQELDKLLKENAKKSSESDQ